MRGGASFDALLWVGDAQELVCLLNPCGHTRPWDHAAINCWRRAHITPRFFGKAEAFQVHRNPS